MISRLVTFLGMAMAGASVIVGCQKGSTPDSAMTAKLALNSSVFREGAVGNVFLQYELVNMSAKGVDTKPGSWRIVVDSVPFSVPLRKSKAVPLGGPSPVGGWGALPAGGRYEFCRGLDLADYVRKSGTYEVWWAGEGFRSPGVLVTVLPRQ